MLETAPALPFIASKLHPPRLTSTHVPRRRLVDRLDGHSDRPLTLVCAPAGSGKSTLLSEWLATTSRPGAWVSLDERDNELVGFVSYLLAAVKTINPMTTLETADMVNALPPPPLEVLAASLSNDLDQIDTDVLLILDDYHVITNPQIDAFLFQLLRHPPRRLHLAVASRAEPSWPLATFRARGQMTELRFADLRFTAEESTAFVRKALGDALDQDLVAVLHAESEGWAVGLQLMTLVAGDHDGPARDWSGGGSSGDLSTYLFGEVLALQPPHVQQHLLELSVLGRFCASLCAAVCARPAETGDPEAWERAFVSRLEHSNLFVIALDAQREFYRFHHLFQRFLADRLRERAAPAQIAALHRRASAWFAGRGLIEEALDHALAAGDAILAADLVAQYRHDFYNREQFARLTRLLRLLPTEVKEHQPEVLLAEARIATLNWRFTEAEVFLDHADEELASSPFSPLRVEIARGELAVLRGILDLWAGNAGRLVTGLQYALQMLPPDASHLRGLAHMGITAGYWQQGDPSRAKAYLTTQLAQTTPDLPMYATLLQTQSFLQWVDGDLSGLLASAQRLLTVSRELELPDQIALAHYFLGTAHFARGELEAARQKLTAAVAARFNLRLLWWCQAAGVLALTEQALGRQQDAQQTLAEAHDFLLERHALRILPNLGAYQAEVSRQQGRLADASAWAVGVEPGPLTWALAALEPALAQARVFLTQTDAAGSERAAALIAELQAFCRRVPNRRLSMETDALAALLADRRGEREVALDTVEGLMREAEADGWVRLFVDLGDPMKGLLTELVTRRAAPHALARILSAFPARLGAAQQPALSEPLSARELEILALLRGVDSIKDIAARLFIAPATVKRHTLSIYRKLKVNNRRAAVARANELGLFPIA